VKKESANTKILVLLGGSGAAVHLVLLHWRMFRRNPAAPSASFMIVLADAAFVLLGGLFYALLLRWPVTESVRAGKISFAMTFLGGWLGTFAGVAALHGSDLAFACAITYKAMTSLPAGMAAQDGSLTMAFKLALLSIETYGLIETFYILIPAFVCGALVTAIVSGWSARRVEHP
jgi:hypothetical protein